MFNLCSCLQSCQQITKLFHFSLSPVLEAGSCLPAWARAAASSSCACRAWSWCQSSTCARSWRTSKHSVTRQVFTAGSTSLSDQKLMGSGQVKYRVSQKHSQDLTLIFSAITWSVFTSSTIFWILMISAFQNTPNFCLENNQRLRKFRCQQSSTRICLCLYILCINYVVSLKLWF